MQFRVSYVQPNRNFMVFAACNNQEVPHKVLPFAAYGGNIGLYRDNGKENGNYFSIVYYILIAHS